MNDHSFQHMQREEYIARINRVIDYIENNLDGDLSLETLANVANFSRFHFHRVFKAMLNETLSRFIQRVRIEKAAMQLTSNPRKSITEIALDTGFSGSASFAKAFREFFAMSASEFRAAGKDVLSKIGKEKGNISEFEGAWDALMGGWMPDSGYQPDDRLCYEINHDDPKQHPEGKHIVDICVPVRPL